MAVSTVADPNIRSRLVYRAMGDGLETTGTRRMAQERVARGRTGGGGALLLEGSFGEDLADLDPADNYSSASTSSDSPTPVPGDMGATYKGACQRLVPPQVPSLVVKKVWRSAKTRTPQDITLVTQLSIDRMTALANQCAVWGGVISVAVHVPLVDGSVVSEDPHLSGSPLSAPLKVLEDFHASQEAIGRCKLDMMYVYEEVPSMEEVGLYPVNALRNRALQLASTEMVALVDADFIPNTDLSMDVADPEHYEVLRRATANRQAIVLPALEMLVEGPEGERLAIKAAEDKEAVRRMMRNDRLQGFHMDGFVNGHRATDFDRWMDAEVAYRAVYEEGYEPYVIVQRSMVPWYDERFKGYRKNKVVHLMHMHHLGMQFVVTPRAWVVHVPHKEADTWRVTQRTGYWKKLKRLYASVVQQMEDDTFVPATAFRCQDRELGKWSWY